MVDLSARVVDLLRTRTAGVTFNDAVGPSCAVGAFDLAADASKQIFCSTSVLLSLLPLTNTASATYPPVKLAGRDQHRVPPRGRPRWRGHCCAYCDF